MLGWGQEGCVRVAAHGLQVSGNLETSVPISGRTSDWPYLLRWLKSHLLNLSLSPLLLSRRMFSFLTVSPQMYWSITPPPMLRQWGHPRGGYDSFAAGEDLSGKGVSTAGPVPAAAGFLHRPTVVGMFSAGQISSLITRHNEVFVILKGKEEKQLRIVWEDDCAIRRSSDKRTTMGSFQNYIWSSFRGSWLSDSGWNWNPVIWPLSGLGGLQFA